MFNRFFILIFKLRGWKIVGSVPPEIKKAVVIAAPPESDHRRNRLQSGEGSRKRRVS
jgi:hypothetical protein